jgi:hypothetical protein
MEKSFSSNDEWKRRVVVEPDAYFQTICPQISQIAADRRSDEAAYLRKSAFIGGQNSASD